MTATITLKHSESKVQGMGSILTDEGVSFRVWAPNAKKVFVVGDFNDCFVRMAMKHGYDIIPVAAVGAEEAFTVVKDANDFFHDNFFGKILEKTGLMDTLLRGGDFVPPLVKGIGNTIIPRPEKCGIL